MSNKRGKLYLFTSYTPGAGKTFRMLSFAAHNCKNLKVAFLFENHRSTDLIWDKLNIERPKHQSYSLSELIELSPEAVAVDEIGMYSRNIDIVKKTVKKKNLNKTIYRDGKEHFIYEDVDELLDNGIDVYASVNLKRFESANSIFSEITGIRVKKKIPDRYLEIAEKIYFIDRDPKLMEADFNDHKLFSDKYMKSKIMKRNFLISTLEEYRRVSIDYIKRYGDKVVIEERIDIV